MILLTRSPHLPLAPGDDDIEGWFFGDSTLDALLVFQACEDLPQTGVVDQATWDRLLEGHVDSNEGSGGAASSTEAAVPGLAVPKAIKSWPVLMETDGGREVHHLQVRQLLGGA
jgi:hypothetical protein